MNWYFFRKKSVNAVIPRVLNNPKTAKEMASYSDENKKLITQKFYGFILDDIKEKARGGNKMLLIKDGYFDFINILSSSKGWILASCTIDFSSLTEMLKADGYRVIKDMNGKITAISWSE